MRADDPQGRAWPWSLSAYVLLGLVFVATTGFGEYKPHWHIYTAAAGFFLALASVAVLLVGRPRIALWRPEVCLFLLAAGAFSGNWEYASDARLVPLLHVAFVAMLLVAGIQILRRAEVDAFPVILAVAAAFYAVVIMAHAEPYIDVWHQMNAAGDSLLQGKNPYRVPIPDFYKGNEAFGFNAPGFTYPPLVLMVATLARFLEVDVRFLWLACTLGAAVLVRGIARRRGSPALVADLLAFLYLFVPRQTWLVQFAHSEPLSGLLLAAAIHCLIAGRAAAGLALLGLFAGSKQYLVVLGPLLLLYAGTPRRMAWLAGGAVLPWAPFAVADLGALWEAAFRVHMVRPARPDALTWNAWRLDHGYRALARWVPLALGAATAAAAGIATRSGRLGVAALAFAIACTVLVTLFLSPQAFCNYYVLVAWCLILAAAAAGPARAGA